MHIFPRNNGELEERLTLNESDATNVIRRYLKDNYQVEDTAGRGLNVNNFFSHCVAKGTHVVLKRQIGVTPAKRPAINIPWTTKRLRGNSNQVLYAT